MNATYDIAIIGAGVVGCAVARRFALAGARVVVIEKGADILSGASKANSAILHTGFDAPPGSLELELVKAGRAEYLNIHGSLGLSIVETGALVCAWAEHEVDALSAIQRQAQENGIADLRVLTGAEARAKLPGLAPHLLAAVEVPGEHVIDPWSAPLAYLTQAVALGADFRRNAEVLSGHFDEIWRIETSGGLITASAVINAAGLYGDRVDACLGLPADFIIKPRKGQFIVLDKAAFAHVPKILLPVPNEITKGIVICPTAFGNVLVGPTAEEQEDRIRATVETATLEMLKAHGAKLVPALADIEVTAVYAGLRPGTEKKNYRVTSHPEKRAITLGGIRSTGLSAALGLAQHALRLHETFGQAPTPPAIVPAVRVPNLTETCPRDWQAPGHGEILCHCEMVTRREVEACLSSPVPPGDYGGLRRRTRAGMGRCQGFYCQGRLAEISAGRLLHPLSVEEGKP